MCTNTDGILSQEPGGKAYLQTQLSQNTCFVMLASNCNPLFFIRKTKDEIIAYLLFFLTEMCFSVFSVVCFGKEVQHLLPVCLTTYNFNMNIQLRIYTWRSNPYFLFFLDHLVLLLGVFKHGNFVLHYCNLGLKFSSLF